QGVPPRARRGRAGERHAAGRLGRSRSGAAAGRRSRRLAAADRGRLGMEAVLAEAAAMPWRRRTSERSLRREGRVWTLWSVGIVITFGAPAVLLVWLAPLAAPVAAIFLGHGIAVLHLQARRGARGVKPLGQANGVAETTALGLLGDLVGHDARELLTRSGLA